MPNTKKRKAKDQQSEEDRKFWQDAQTYIEVDGDIKRLGVEKATISERLVNYMIRQRDKKRTNTSGLSVTLAASTTVVYDAEAIRKDATKRQRDVIFDRFVDLSALTLEERVDLLSSLTPAQKKRVIKYVLNESKLAEAVENEVVTAEWVAERSEIKKAKPYVRVTSA